MKLLLFLPVIAITIAIASCTMVGPDYIAPDTKVAATYKAVGLSAPLSSAAWWSSFADPTLNSLLARTEKSSPDARAALARLDQSRAILGLTRTDRLPSLKANALGERQQESANDRFPSPGGPFNRYNSTLNLNYEIDLWGSVRRGVARQQATTQSFAGDYAAVILSIKGEVARNYISLRHLDSEMALLRRTIKLREENERLVIARVAAGDTTSINSSRARSQTERTRAEFHRLKQRRDELENAIGALIGTSASNYRIAQGKVPRTPSVPSGVPAELLRRRPDVYASERRLAAASEAIGVTLGKYLPQVSLTASAGYASLSSSDLFNHGSRLWDIGPSVSLPAITFGRKERDLTRARAAYTEALELHRQSVLNAFRDVENALSGIQNISRALTAQAKSARAASEAARLIRLRHDAGLVNFFEVIDADRESLAEQRSLVQTRAARQLATVQLIQALGGGWKRPE